MHGAVGLTKQGLAYEITSYNSSRLGIWIYTCEGSSIENRYAACTLTLRSPCNELYPVPTSLLGNPSHASDNNHLRAPSTPVEISSVLSDFKTMEAYFMPNVELFIISIILLLIITIGGSGAQAVRRSHLTAGVPSSRLGQSIWVSWWTKLSLCRFSRVFCHFPLPHFISPFLHTHLIL